MRTRWEERTAGWRRLFRGKGLGMGMVVINGHVRLCQERGHGVKGEAIRDEAMMEEIYTHAR